ncbi:carboxypeptidase-like regulatory domain-containing protein [Bacteroidota bacterium]
MKPVFVSIGFCCLSICCIAQIFSGRLTDGQSGEAVPYANIGVVGKNIGTASDATGWFELELNPLYDYDTLGVSCIGYETSKMAVHVLKSNAKPNDRVEIELVPRTYQLKEVTVRPMKSREYILGNFCDPDSPYGNAFYTKQLGTEIGVVIQLPRKNKRAFLKEFRFYVGRFTYDKFPVRVNIYSLLNGLPNRNILTRQIFVEITSEGEYRIDLKQYNIVTRDDFFISLEFYRVPDNTEGELIFCATKERKKSSGKGYYRFTSQGNWMPEIVANVGFSVIADCEK